MRRFIYIIMFVSFLQACELETEWKLEPSESVLIADCIITNEYKRHELFLYRSSDSLNQPVNGYPDAHITITDGSENYSFSPDPSFKGRYISDIPFRATVGKEYMLTIESGGIWDTAFASMTGVAPLEESVIVPDSDYYRYVHNPSSTGYMIEIYYDWSSAPAFCEQYGACAAMETYYVLNNIDLGKIFAPERQKILFPVHTTIIRKKYSLSEEHQEFARSLMLETEWRGGIFDAEAGNLPTNFRNGLQGWFGACTVVSDTIRFMM